MEKVDIYNARHESLNYQKGRKELTNREYRLSSFIWIINDNREILLQQRLATAKKMPNMWGTTAGGVRSGETSLEGAIRELDEELGIKTSKEDIEFIGSYKRVNDFVEVYFCKKNISIDQLILNPNEVANAKWASINEFEKMLKNGIGIASGYDIFKLYYNNFYNKHYEFIDGIPTLVDNE